MKVTYEIEGGWESTAYLNRKLSDGSWVGTNKHTDQPVHVKVIDGRWQLVCLRHFELDPPLYETFHESFPRPECICKEMGTP